jgi:hypothetical protein
MAEQEPQNQPDEALVDLLIKQVTEGLSSAEQRSLEAQDSEASSRALRELEQAAAAVTLAANNDGTPLPAGLAQKIAAQADAHFAKAGTVSDIAAARSARQARPAGSSGALGWLAAAACLIVAIFGWMRSPPGPAPAAIVEAPKPQAPLPPREPTLAERRDALLAQADSLKITLAATKDPAAAGVTGDVVWDAKTQKGYLHFVGLASNDPKVHQYQIWIFDAERDKRYPIDGGVFDVPADANDIVIPIHAALQVLKPAAFAVTVEKPGGVVVSARDHVVVLGAAG